MPPLTGNSRLRVIPILLAQGFGVACGIAGVKLNSHLIPPEILGVYGVFLTLAPIGMWVVHAGLVKFVTRHWAAAPSRAALLRDVLVVWAKRLPWLAMAAVAGAVAMGRLSPAANVIALSAALFASSALLAANALAQSALQAERAHWRDCAVSVGGSLSRTFVPPLLFLATTGTLSALGAGFCIHALITAGVGAWALRAYRNRANASRPARLELGAAYGGTMFMSLAAAGWILAGMNRWIVAAFFGDIEAGYFTLAGGAAVVISSTLGAVFVQYFQPGIFALGDLPSMQRTTLARRVDVVAVTYAATGLGAVIGLAWAGPLLVGPIISENYRASLVWILPAGCFGVAIITTVFYQSLLLAGRRERACAPVELSTAATLVVGSTMAAAGGSAWLERWLVVTPVVPWLLTRPLARSYFFKPDAIEGPVPAR